MKGLDDGPDGLNDRAFDRALGVAPAAKPKRARKPKTSPFKRCENKLGDAFAELDRAMRSLPGYDAARGTTWGHWAQVDSAKYARDSVWVRGPWVVLAEAEQVAEFMDAIREACRG